MQSQAKTVQAYLAELPADRRGAIATVRAAILKNLPKGYEETIQYGMISYIIPFSRFPKTYNHQPLAIASLASQKNHMALYLMCVYGDEKIRTWFEEAVKASGKKIALGKACIRFKKVDDLPLEVLGKAIAKVSVEKFIEIYERSRQK